MIMFSLFCAGKFRPVVAYNDNGDACIDLPYNGDEEFVFNLGTVYRIPTKCHVEIPLGMSGIIFERSGLGAKYGVTIHGRVIDPNYRGEIIVIAGRYANFVHDLDSHEYKTISDLRIKPGDRIAQLLISYAMPNFKFVDGLHEMSKTNRGTNGLGSSGLQTNAT